jgi:uncharacterized membrane protein
MAILKRILILAACVLALTFPVLVYAEGDLGGGSDSATDTPDIEQTTTGGDAADSGAATGDAATGTEPGDGTETEAIPEEETPLSKRSFESGWALVNLLASLVSIIIGVALMTHSMLRRSRDERSDFGSSQLPQNFGLAVFGMLAAVISTILFTSTEDLGSRMILVDSFTVVHIAVLAVAVLCAVLSIKKDVGDPIDLEK